MPVISAALGHANMISTEVYAKADVCSRQYMERAEAPRNAPKSGLYLPLDGSAIVRPRLRESRGNRPSFLSGGVGYGLTRTLPRKRLHVRLCPSSAARISPIRIWPANRAGVFKVADLAHKWGR